MTLSETIELISKAMEGVTPGKWESEHGSAYGPVMSYNVSANARKVLSPVVCHIVDHPEAKANAAYIAACSPDRMRVVLAAAREAEALKREIAEKDARIAALEAGLVECENAAERIRLNLIRHLDEPVRSSFWDGVTIRNMSRALLSKESAEQDGSAINSNGGDHG